MQPKQHFAEMSGWGVKGCPNSGIKSVKFYEGNQMQEGEFIKQPVRYLYVVVVQLSDLYARKRALEWCFIW